ncbi:dimethylarginine dimethylaminohydrolase family protein [Roseovarius sp.]|uniref:dimethylarginine dimethylaminohydrolase family protein n=1 Tax=Roseovarius sp. TaxID=1486281 RepID=UPI003BA86D22
MRQFHIADEFAPLRHVVMGRGAGYHRDGARVEVVNETHRHTLARHGHPTEAQVVAEFAGFRTALEGAGVTLHIPDLAPETVQDQTCPRDIGFVIGDTFVTAAMRNASRAEEIRGLDRLLASFTGPRLSVPPGITLEGGDVIVAGPDIFVGVGQRSDPEGAAFLRREFGDIYSIHPVPTRPLSQGEDVLHLDCAFQPLGLGHALIYPTGLDTIPAAMRHHYDWIEVTRDEAAALSTNVLSLAPDHLVARDHPACARVNAALRAAGYRVDELPFNAVPSTGGAFRCATLPLARG